MTTRGRHFRRHAQINLRILLSMKIKVLKIRYYVTAKLLGSIKKSISKCKNALSCISLYMTTCDVNCSDTELLLSFSGLQRGA